jgi:5-methylcytosine-specific restriction endonuclease McrA
MPDGEFFDRRIPYLYRKLVDRHCGPLPFSAQEYAAKVYEAIAKGCSYCRSRLSFKTFSSDHIVPVSRGGSWELSNIEIVCYTCNKRKSHRNLADFLRELDE